MLYSGRFCSIFRAITALLFGPFYYLIYPDFDGQLRPRWPEIAQSFSQHFEPVELAIWASYLVFLGVLSHRYQAAYVPENMQI